MLHRTIFHTLRHSIPLPMPCVGKVIANFKAKIKIKGILSRAHKKSYSQTSIHEAQHTEFAQVRVWGVVA